VQDALRNRRKAESQRAKKAENQPWGGGTFPWSPSSVCPSRAVRKLRTLEAYPRDETGQLEIPAHDTVGRSSPELLGITPWHRAVADTRPPPAIPQGTPSGRRVGAETGPPSHHGIPEQPGGGQRAKSDQDDPLGRDSPPSRSEGAPKKELAWRFQLDVKTIRRALTVTRRSPSPQVTSIVPLRRSSRCTNGSSATGRRTCTVTLPSFSSRDASLQLSVRAT